MAYYHRFLAFTPVAKLEKHRTLTPEMRRFDSDQAYHSLRFHFVCYTSSTRKVVPMPHGSTTTTIVYCGVRPGDRITVDGRTGRVTQVNRNLVVTVKWDPKWEVWLRKLWKKITFS